MNRLEALAGGLTIQPGNERGRGVINHMLTLSSIDTAERHEPHAARVDALIDYVLATDRYR